MKTMRFLMLGLLAATLTANAQDDPDPGRLQIDNPIAPISPDTNAQAHTLVQPAYSSPTGYAEAITPEIQALANGLQNDPVKIFNYVHDHIRFVLYFGSMKGAELTLLEQSGNDFDQCSLLVALLQAAGYSPGYGFGLQQIPYQATDGTANDLQHWWQLNLTSNDWSSVSTYIGWFIGNRGYSVWADMGDNNHAAIQRVWVTLPVGGTTYLLDPAFKISQPASTLAGFSLANAIGSGAVVSNALLTAAGGTDTGNYAKSLSEPSVRAKLTAYTTNLLGYLQNNFPNASVQDIMGGWQILPSTNTALNQSLLFSIYNPSGYSSQTWSSIPTNFMSNFSVNFGGTNQTWFTPQLQGQGLSLSFDHSGKATLWLGNNVVQQSSSTGSGSSTAVILTIKHPFGGWDTANNVPTDTGWADESVSHSYQRTNANYAILYGFEPSLKWLNAQEQQLDLCRQQGYSNTSPQVVNATLNVMGMEWLAQTELSQDLICQQEQLLPEYHHRIGRMAQESGHGYYVDVYMESDGTFPATGHSAVDLQKKYNVMDVGSYIASALEHGTIEQLQNAGLVAASTIKMLQLANTNGQSVYLATSNNWSSIRGSLSNYGALTNTFTSVVSQGGYLLLPQNGSIAIAGTGSWKGNGYVEITYSASGRGLGMMIGGGYNGGYVSDPTATVSPDYTALTVFSQPNFFSLTPFLTPSPTTADPVDTANGTFQVENTDLSLGQAEPRGITLSRYYNGTRRNSNPAGMAGGWIHNYCATANNVAAPQAGLGGTTPAQMAAMIVTTYAALNLYNNTQPDPKNWLTTVLIAKWGVDQLIKNGVSVSLGKDTVQFIKQPDGSFTPPANSTLTLLQTNSAYWLQQRHGDTFKFSATGYLTNIADQYGQALSVTYNASNWVSTVKDWKGRTLTFSYSGTPQRLASVTDGTRTVSYGYATNSNPRGDLVSFTDAEGKASTYAYDTNHEMTATLDALSRLVVSNVYDGNGHIAVQYTQGDTNKTWKIFWSSWQTVSQDPAGAQQIYYYDDKSRLIGQQDALGNLTQTAYDGRNHIVQTVSPLNETNLFVFDGNNNLVQKIDALGFTNQFVYDGQNNLARAVDPLGNPTTFGYNAQFSLIGQTNGAGDWINYAYNTDGTLQSRTDDGGQTTFGYDSFGQLKTVAYPNSLGGITNFNNAYGDITNTTDARGFAKGFQYNNRRQLTNVVGPTNLTVKISFDPVGNAVTRTDPRGNTVSNSWSATRHLLATVLPATSQGIPVATNGYDRRDLLVNSVDLLGNPTLYTNDLAGRLQSVTDPLKRTALLNYDNDGRVLAVANAAHETNSQTWDARGSLVQATDGAGHFSTRAHDAAGNQIILTNRNGKAWQFQFDGANRLTKTTTPLGRSTQLTFNHQGLVSSITDAASQPTSLFYDAKGRLTNRTDNVATTYYGYDANDNPVSVVENGRTNAWTCDAYNRVSSYRDTAGNLIQYRYDVAGNLTNLVYPGAKNVYYAFDSLNRMTNVTDWSGRKTGISYDLNSHVTSIVRPNGSYRTIGYDAAGQATNIMEQMSNSLPIAIFSHGWTNTGTMAWEFAAPLPHTATVTTRTMTYDDDNRLLTVNGSSVTSDLDGNLTYAPLTNGTCVTQTFDARNRLLNAGGATNIYDAMNNRIGQAQGTNVATFVVNPNNKLPQVLMRVKNGVTNYYIYGSGLLYQITETATFTNTRTYHYDYRGSAIALSADSGLVTDRIEYSAYGLTTYRIGGTDTPFLFNGRYGVQTDGNGLLYMRARHYNPYLCRFISADPSGFSGGLNHYAYANGNPVSYLDPFGLTNWKQVGEGALELTGAGIATAGIILTEAPSFGTSTLLISGVTLGITKGEADLAAGFADVPPSSPVGEGVNSIPSNLGALVASPFGQDAQDTAGLAFDIATLRFSSGPDFFESLSSGNNLLLNTTAFGVDATSVGLGVYNMTYGTEGAGNQIVSPLQNQSFWNYSLTINPSGSSTGK